jgi:hypothetical protein
MTVKVATPATVSLDRIWSLQCPVTGRSNAVGLKSVLKMITSITRSLLRGQSANEAYSAGGTRCEDSDSAGQRKEFIEEPPAILQRDAASITSICPRAVSHLSMKSK